MPAARRPSLAFLPLLATVCLGATACTGDPDDGEDTATWTEATDVTGAGAMSGVWGTGPDDVWVVGGSPDAAAIFHHDGTDWTEEAVPAGVPLLVWVYGFASDDVWSVGTEGKIVHWDGSAWSEVDSGTTQDLWGVFGFSPDDFWVVGGDLDAPGAVLLHYDGTAFEPYTLLDEENPFDIDAMFKVWGIDGRLFAVGQAGTILEHDGTDWRFQDAGSEANDDFVSLWGTSSNEILAVGGRARGLIARFDGTTWTAEKPQAVPGLNAVFVDGADAVIGGIQGFVGHTPLAGGDVEDEGRPTPHDVHAIWGDGTGAYYGVGGRFTDPYEGVILKRTP